MADMLSGLIFIVFTALLTIGAVSTLGRWFRYTHLKMRKPVLLGRDRDLLLGLAVPFLVIGAVRAFGLLPYILDANGDPHIWYLLLTGLPPIYALLRYDFYELRVIERQSDTLEERATEAAERTAEATERIADQTDPKP